MKRLHWGLPPNVPLNTCEVGLLLDIAPESARRLVWRHKAELLPWHSGGARGRVMVRLALLKKWREKRAKKYPLPTGE